MGKGAQAGGDGGFRGAKARGKGVGEPVRVRDSPSSFFTGSPAIFLLPWVLLVGTFFFGWVGAGFLAFLFMKVFAVWFVLVFFIVGSAFKDTFKDANDFVLGAAFVTFVFAPFPAPFRVPFRVPSAPPLGTPFGEILACIVDTVVSLNVFNCVVESWKGKTDRRGKDGFLRGGDKAEGSASPKEVKFPSLPTLRSSPSNARLTGTYPCLCYIKDIKFSPGPPFDTSSCQTCLSTSGDYRHAHCLPSHTNNLQGADEVCSRPGGKYHIDL